MYIYQSIRTENTPNGSSRHALVIHWVQEESTYCGLVDVVNEDEGAAFKIVQKLAKSMPTYYIKPGEWNRRVKSYMVGGKNRESLTGKDATPQALAWHDRFDHMIELDRLEQQRINARHNV